MKPTFTLLFISVLLLGNTLYAQMPEGLGTYKTPLEFVTTLLHPGDVDGKQMVNNSISVRMEKSCTNYPPKPGYFDSAGLRWITIQSYPVFLLNTNEPFVYKQQADTFFCSDSADIATNYTLYNAEGRLTYRIQNDKKYNYTYNKQGNVSALLVSGVSNDWLEYEYFELYTMTYEKNGNLKTLNYHSNASKLVYFDAKLQRIVVKEFIVQDYDTVPTINHEYFLRNNKIYKYIKTELSPDYIINGQQYAVTINFEWDKNGLLSRAEEQTNTAGEAKTTTILKYDKQANLVYYKSYMAMENKNEIYVMDSISYMYNSKKQIETATHNWYTKENFDDPENNFSYLNSTCEYYYLPNGMLRKQVVMDNSAEPHTTIYSYVYE